MAHRFRPSRYESERRFPHKVDIPTLATDRERQVNELERWCCENIRAGHWQQHPRREPHKGEAPGRYLRFYFLSEDDAQAFRRRWAGTAS